MIKKNNLIVLFFLFFICSSIPCYAENWTTFKTIEMGYTLDTPLDFGSSVNFDVYNQKMRAKITSSVSVNVRLYAPYPWAERRGQGMDINTFKIESNGSTKDYYFDVNTDLINEALRLYGETSFNLSVPKGYTSDVITVELQIDLDSSPIKTHVKYIEDYYNKYVNISTFDFIPEKEYDYYLLALFDYNKAQKGKINLTISNGVNEIFNVERSNSDTSFGIVQSIKIPANTKQLVFKRISELEMYKCVNVQIYKVKKDAWIEINSDKTTLGDNTKLPLTIDVSSPIGSTINFFSSSNKLLASYTTETLPTGVHNIQVPTESLKLNINDSVFCTVISSTGNTLATSNVISVNKKNVLNNILEILKNKSGMDKAIIIEDIPRYFDKNDINLSLINEIKKENATIYIINQDIDEIFLPLLEN